MDKKEWTSLDWVRDSIDIDKHNLRIYTEDLDIHNMQNVTQKLKYLKMVEADLEVLDILKKFFNFNAYYKRSVNGDFLEIIAKEDEEANIDRKAISFIDSDSRKLLREWLDNGINNK